MKSSIRPGVWVFGVLAVIVAGVTWFLMTSAPNPLSESALGRLGEETVPSGTDIGSADPQTSGNAVTNNKTVVEKATELISVQLARQRYAAQQREREELYKSPISFYGKVVDEQSNAVSEAVVELHWQDLSPSGSRSTVLSDADGRFSLLDVTGRSLFVKVSKQGYYVPQGQQTLFSFASQNGTPHPADLANPVIFQLRKRGSGVELVTSQYGVNSHLGISPPKDGSPVWIDFFERKMGGSGQMELRKLTPVKDRTDRTPTEWRLTLSISDGGFVELMDDEFPFYPPETGYQPVLDFHYPPDREGYVNRINGKYYIAFGNPRRYGRIEVSATATGGVRLEYVVNPDGRPYLEPKEVVIE